MFETKTKETKQIVWKTQFRRKIMKFGAKEKYILCPSCLIREYPTLVRASRAASSAATAAATEATAKTSTTAAAATKATSATSGSKHFNLNSLTFARL